MQSHDCDNLDLQIKWEKWLFKQLIVLCYGYLNICFSVNVCQ